MSGSNPGPGENFSLKLTTQGLPDCYSEKNYLKHIRLTLIFNML